MGRSLRQTVGKAVGQAERQAGEWAGRQAGGRALTAAQVEQAPHCRHAGVGAGHIQLGICSAQGRVRQQESLANRPVSGKSRLVEQAVAEGLRPAGMQAPHLTRSTYWKRHHTQPGPGAPLHTHSGGMPVGHRIIRTDVVASPVRMVDYTHVISAGHHIKAV